MSIEQQEFEESSRILKALEQSINIQAESLETQHHSYGVLKEILEGTAHNERLAAKSLKLLEQIAADLASAPTLTASIAVQFKGDNTIMADNVLSLAVGQTSTASIMPYLADGVTNSGGVVSATTYTFSDPSATMDPASGLVTGVADSAGVAVSGSAACTVTDTDGVVSTWTQAFTITTGGGSPPPPPAQLTQSIGVQFSAPALSASTFSSSARR